MWRFNFLSVIETVVVCWFKASPASVLAIKGTSPAKQGKLSSLEKFLGISIHKQNGLAESQVPFVKRFIPLSSKITPEATPFLFNYSLREKSTKVANSCVAIIEDYLVIWLYWHFNEKYFDIFNKYCYDSAVGS